MSDYIPNDLLMKIFLFLPAKTLVRFSCVSKSWNSLITSSNFINAHLNRTRLSTSEGGNHLLLLRYYGAEPEKERFSLRIDNVTLDLYKNLDFSPRTVVEPYFRVLGSCNGLVCLADDLGCKMTRYILWNPTIRKSLTLPVPRFTYMTYGPYDDAIGFGFDSQSNDYKVVRMVFLQSEDGKYPRVELFKLSTGSWETISATIDHCYLVQYDDRGQVFLNGAVHWNAYKRNTYIDCNVIMSFDMSNEVFHEIMLPDCYRQHRFTEELSVALCGQYLSLFCYHRPCWNSISVIKEIWVMKEYGVVVSWTKLYTIRPNGEVGKPIGFMRTGVMLASWNGELFSYDPEFRVMVSLDICEYNQNLRRQDRSSFYVGAYEESLVLLGYGKRPGQDSNVSKKVKDDKGNKKNRVEAGISDEL